jgi:hypothetical protein
MKDGSLEITTEAALFQANGMGYATFTEALTAALAEGADGKVKLLGTVSLTATVKISGTVELDLNGQTITGSDKRGALIEVQSGAELTIIDTFGGGKIAPTAGDAIKNLGVLTINAGTYDAAIVGTSGTLTINDGKFEVALNYTGTLTDNGGKFKHTTGLPTVTDKEYRDDDDDGYYTLEDVAGSGDDDPVIGDAIDDDVGKVEETTDGEGNKTATVTVTNASTSVTIQVPTGYQGTVNVVVPPTVDTITGLGAATLTVKAEGVDITGAFSKATDDLGKVRLTSIRKVQS